MKESYFPGPVEPPNEETADVYRVAVLAYREAFAGEVRSYGWKKANRHIPHASATVAVLKLKTKLEPAGPQNHSACSCAAQAMRAAQGIQL